jgi:hypothetical protein
MVDSTSLITYHHLAPWLQGNLVLVDLMFNFEDPKNDFDSQLDSMLQDFEEGDYKEYFNFYFVFLALNILIRWTRFLVVISTHSDPRTGDLHIAPGNTGSAPANQVRFFIFCDYYKILNSIPAVASYFPRALPQVIKEKREEQKPPQSICLWGALKSSQIQRGCEKICIPVCVFHL